MSHSSLEEGGICYLACEELFEYFNNSKYFCYKGCDFGKGRVNFPEMRKQAENMCKRLANEVYYTNEDVAKIRDLRMNAFSEPDDAASIYKACLAGIRRQRF